MVTIYTKFRFDYHKGKQPDIVNAYLLLKIILLYNPLCYFQNA